jgi:bifunctional UDP-N-acetylglucosamine pyrophosphorylase/glucosamine-1-phosphate N-acetyltransferase
VARVDDSSGYGRVLRTPDGAVAGVLEHADASPEQRSIREINTGILCASAAHLTRWTAALRNDNAKQEYYLTDCVAMAVAEGRPVLAVTAVDATEAEGVNDPAQLARAERHFQRRQASELMEQGLFLADPERFDLRGRLNHGRDVFIDVGCVLIGDLSLGDGVRIGPHCVLQDVRLGAGTRVEAHSVLDGVVVGADCSIGPFARLRPGSELAAGVQIGNFVEVKKARLGAGTKAGHLAYLGDADIGAEVNISAGVITCNYDGANKHPTTIGDGAFIGSDSQLVAPVTIGERAYIAAGSTITRDAPADQLTLRRVREQRSIPGWTRPKQR